MCYIRLAMEVGLFFMPFFKGLSLSLKKPRGTRKAKSTKKFNGGGSCAHKNNIGMYRV